MAWDYRGLSWQCPQHDNFRARNYLMGSLHALGAVANFASMFRACFTGETQVPTRRGWVRFDELKVNDEVLSGPENDPLAPPDYKLVEEVFVTYARIWHMHVGGQVIRTTAEHPFYVWGKGWVPAGELKPGDRLRSHDGRMVTVEEVCDGGYEETVYNCRVADWHTYFVGQEEWQFTVWAHNAACLPITGRPAHRGPTHNITMVREALAVSALPGISGVRTNQALVDTAGRTLSLLRPDVQYIQGGLVHLIEVNVSRGSAYHGIRESQLRSVLGSLFGSYIPL